MAIAWRSPASLADVVALAPGVMMPSAYWRALITQIAAGASLVALDEAGAPLLVVGLLPAGHGCEVLWLAAAPAAGRRMVGLMRVLRLTLGLVTLGLACESRSVTVYGYVAPGHAPTARMLALLGFVRAGRDHGFDRWERQFGGNA